MSVLFTSTASNIPQVSAKDNYQRTLVELHCKNGVSGDLDSGVCLSGSVNAGAGCV